MQLWVVLISSALCLVLLLALVAVEIEFNAQGVGEASGAWAAAFGVACAGVVVSGVCARQQAIKFDVRFLRWKVDLARLTRRRTRRPKAPVRQRPGGGIRAHFDLSEALDLGLRELRRVEVVRVDAALSYGFRDIALTGRLAGALYALSGILPAAVHFEQTVRWDGGERWEASASGRIALSPGRVLFDALWFMLRARWRRRGPSPTPKPTPAPSVLGSSEP